MTDVIYNLSVYINIKIPLDNSLKNRNKWDFNVYIFNMNNL